MRTKKHTFLNRLHVCLCLTAQQKEWTWVLIMLTWFVLSAPAPGWWLLIYMQLHYESIRCLLPTALYIFGKTLFTLWTCNLNVRLMKISGGYTMCIRTLLSWCYIIIIIWLWHDNTYIITTWYHHLCDERDICQGKGSCVSNLCCYASPWSRWPLSQLQSLNYWFVFRVICPVMLEVCSVGKCAFLENLNLSTAAGLTLSNNVAL